MNYQISEDEYNSLESLKNQLGLIAGLLSVSNFDLGFITSSELFAFLNARSEDLAHVLKITSERQSLQLEQAKENGTMSWVNWLHALRLVSGDALHTPNHAEQSITQKLTKAAHIDEDVQQVLTEWHAALNRANDQRMLATTQTRPQPKLRKSSPQVATA